MRVVSDLLAFLVELAALAAVAFWFHRIAQGGVTGWIAALAGAAVFIGLWGRFAAPKSRHRLTGGALLGFKIAVFTAGAAMLLPNGALAAGFFALAAIHLALAVALGKL